MILDRVLDGQDLLGRVVGNFEAELLLERHDQLDRIEAVGAQIVDEARILGHLGFVDTQVLDHDLLHPLGDVAHRCCLFVSFSASGNWIHDARRQPA